MFRTSRQCSPRCTACSGPAAGSRSTSRCARETVDLPYPLPWAEDERSSFVETVADYRAHLETAGFEVEDEVDRTPTTLGPPPQGPISNAVIFGPPFVHRIANNVAATKADLLGAWLFLARA